MHERKPVAILLRFCFNGIIKAQRGLGRGWKAKGMDSEGPIFSDLEEVI